MPFNKNDPVIKICLLAKQVLLCPKSGTTVLHNWNDLLIQVLKRYSYALNRELLCLSKL